MPIPKKLQEYLEKLLYEFTNENKRNLSTKKLIKDINNVIKEEDSLENDEKNFPTYTFNDLYLINVNF